MLRSFDAFDSLFRSPALATSGLFHLLGAHEELHAGPSAPRQRYYETPEAYVFEADLPDVKAEDVSVELKNRILSISASSAPSAPDGYQLRRSERVAAQLSTRVRLPQASDSEKVDAKLENGLLRVTIAKAPVATPKRIEVNVSR